MGRYAVDVATLMAMAAFVGLGCIEAAPYFPAPNVAFAAGAGVFLAAVLLVAGIVFAFAWMLAGASPSPEPAPAVRRQAPQRSRACARRPAAAVHENSAGHPWAKRLDRLERYLAEVE